MKYIIKSSRVNSIIYKFIDNEFTEDNLTWDYDINYDTEDTERNILNFYGEKYQRGSQDEWYFQYIKTEYYETVPDKILKPLINYILEQIYPYLIFSVCIFALTLLIAIIILVLILKSGGSLGGMNSMNSIPNIKVS